MTTLPMPAKGSLKSAIGKKLGQPTAPDDMAGPMPGPMPAPASASPIPPSAASTSSSTASPSGLEASDPQDIQIITEASAHDPVIAAIARVLGIGA